MIIKEENIISNLLLSKKGVVLEPKQSKRKETDKETYNRILKQVNENEGLRLIKKNLH